MSTKKLLKLKDKIETAKTDQAKFKGRLESSIELLKNKFKCTSVKDAESKLNELKDKLTKKENKLEKNIENLEGKYEWT